jgi:hypothetical protein
VALTDPQNTLAYHASRVLCAQREMSDVPCFKVALALSQYQDAHSASDLGHSVPEQQALWFYGMNHGVALIQSRFAPLEPLPEWELGFVERYHAELAPRAIRAFYYLLLICTREARHNQSLGKDKLKMTEKFGKPIADFFASIKGGESTIHQKFLSNPPQGTIGTYCEALCWQFYNSSWAGGYGGSAWGNIADCLHRFVTGEFSAEMMLDTIWTLSHNNGPVFNKGLFYQMYNPAAILRLLDVQRSGQIPQAVLDDKVIGGYADPELKKLMSQLQARFPSEIGDYVDWEVVETLGSVGKYPAEKQAQFAKYGMSEAAKEAQAKAKLIQQQKEEAAKKEAEEHAKNWFTVMPGVEVKKFQPLRQIAA